MRPYRIFVDGLAKDLMTIGFAKVDVEWKED
jgi:hypothetical protein